MLSARHHVDILHILLQLRFLPRCPGIGGNEYLAAARDTAYHRGIVRMNCRGHLGRVCLESLIDAKPGFAVGGEFVVKQNK